MSIACDLAIMSAGLGSICRAQPNEEVWRVWGLDLVDFAFSTSSAACQRPLALLSGAAGNAMDLDR